LKRRHQCITALSAGADAQTRRISGVKYEP
jgi:hypothetical protein